MPHPDCHPEQPERSDGSGRICILEILPKGAKARGTPATQVTSVTQITSSKQQAQLQFNYGHSLTEVRTKLSPRGLPGSARIILPWWQLNYGIEDTGFAR